MGWKLKTVSKAYYKRKLTKQLGMTFSRDLLALVWSADRLRNGHYDTAKRYLSFPNEIVESIQGGQINIFPWTLETLINESLTKPSANTASRRTLNTGVWPSFVTLYSLVQKIENSESLDDISEGGILDAMPRIGWRQFGWQIGYRSAQRFFRAWLLYNFTEANDYFSNTFNISVERFCYVGFAVSAHLEQFPAIRTDCSLEEIGISEREMTAFFGLVCTHASSARETAMAIRSGPGQIAYKPSVLRKTPLISVGHNRIVEAFCPLPALLALRFTDGIFYDLIDDDNLRRIIGTRFENYVTEVTRHYIEPNFEFLPEETYGPRGRSRATPDLRFRSAAGSLQLIIECKSRRIPFKVLASSKPFDEHQEIYSEIIKGVIQLWRYASDVRCGVTDDGEQLSPDAVGVVLMLEPWLQMSGTTIKSIIDAAIEECSEQTDILNADRIPIAFVSIEDWEQSIKKISADGFLEALRLHAGTDRHGYLLSSVVEEMGFEEDVEGVFDYFGGLSRVVPWWNDILERSSDLNMDRQPRNK